MATAVYTTKAKSLIARPLRERGIAVDATQWREAGIQLYGLWQKMTPEQVKERQAFLSQRNKNRWRETFPDDWQIDEAKLIALYKASEPLQANGVHAWNDLTFALRFYVAEMLAPASKNLGVFDWGGSDGITCTFLRHHGAKDVHLFEPNQAARDFCTWLNDQLGISDLTVHEEDPAGRTFGAGVCTEVLEHVVNPPAMCKRFYDLLEPGGVMFVTSSFQPTQETHLKQNLKYNGKENELMLNAGFKPWQPPVRPPVPMLPQWGFWRKG
ncbi:MAG: methyltransferase domain-containing protein [Tepidisphaeraceae bacterium]